MREKYYSTRGVKLARSRRAHNAGKILVGKAFYPRHYRLSTLLVLSLTVLASLSFWLYGEALKTEQTYQSLIPETYAFVAPSPTPSPEPTMDDDGTEVDILIGKAVVEFLPDHASEARMIMHCLAHRENGHGANPEAHGDNGLAGGPFQFHQSTWDRMRTQMITEGVAGEIGSRYDFKEAARTTAWAIAHGRALEWGPILRDSKGSDYASCQTPSWYRK